MRKGLAGRDDWFIDFASNSWFISYAASIVFDVPVG